MSFGQAAGWSLVQAVAASSSGGVDADHGIFGGTLPAERSRLRGNTFPAPSADRQHRELAEQVHQLAGQVGLRQAARQLGIHRDALTAAFTHCELPMPERRVGWQPSESAGRVRARHRLGSLSQGVGTGRPGDPHCPAGDAKAASSSTSNPPPGGPGGTEGSRVIGLMVSRSGGHHQVVGLLGVRSHTSKKESRSWPDTSS
jgi:hypothetical protein